MSTIPNATPSAVPGVYVQTNEADANRVVAFRRKPDGTLVSLGSHPTGGAGTGVAHLTSQGSVVLAGDGATLLVTNAGSDDVSVFAVASDRIELTQTIDSGGSAPKSVAEHEGLVYVLNTGDESLTGFRLRGSSLVAIPDSRRELGGGSDPAQVGFAPDGRSLVVTQRGTDSIVVFAVGGDGLLGRRDEVASSGPTPYGFAFTADGTLVVTEAFGAMVGRAAASSYVPAGSSVAPVSRSVGNGRSEICWAVVSADSRYAFTTNFADGAVSRYAIGRDGDLQLEDAAAGTAVEGQAGLRDEDLTADGRFLYAVDADARRIFGWAVQDAGALEPVGSWDGLPPTVAGLAAG